MVILEFLKASIASISLYTTEQTKTAYAAFSIRFAKSGQRSRYCSSHLDEILHKPARKNPIMTPAESHAMNHIGHSFLSVIGNSPFSSSASEFARFQGKVQIICQ
jgi:hypothetical protein